MANSKISALTSATTPLAGTETLPIVQSSVTKQVSVADLTAGRSVSASKLTTTNATDVVIENIINQPNASYYAALTLQNTGASGKTYQLTVGGNTSAVPGGMYIYNVTNGNTPVILVDSSNNLTVGLGNVVIGTSGKGIDFSATPGTGTSELLADYEEGTFTPVLAGTSGGTATYSVQVGRYRKIGSFVCVWARVDLATVGTLNGFITVDNLPFASQNTTNYYSIGTLILENTTFTGSPVSFMNPNSTNAYLLLSVSGATVGFIGNGNITSSTTVTICICYHTA